MTIEDDDDVDPADDGATANDATADGAADGRGITKTKKKGLNKKVFF